METDSFDTDEFPTYKYQTVYQTVSGSLYTLNHEMQLRKLNSNGFFLQSLGKYRGVIDAQDIFDTVAGGSIYTYAQLLKEQLKNTTVWEILTELHQSTGFLRGIPSLLRAAQPGTLEKLLTVVLFKKAQPKQILVASSRDNIYNYTTPIHRQIR